MTEEKIMLTIYKGTKDEKWIHENQSRTMAYFYNNNEDYENRKKIFLIKCHRCDSWILPKDKIYNDKHSRVGNLIIHERCR